MDVEKDVKNFHFRQLRKVNVAPPTDSTHQRVSLLVVSSTYGLTCIGIKQGLLVFQTAVLQEIASLGRDPAPVNSLRAVSVSLPASPLFLALSAEENRLCVCVSTGHALKYIFYDLPSLYTTRGTSHPICDHDIQIKANVSVNCIQWNPGEFPDLVATCLSSGEVFIIPAINGSVQLTKMEPSMSACSLCWSPRGKQIAVGLMDGSICQLGLDLKEKKRVIPFPNELSGEKTQAVVDLHWISTYEFIAAYSPLIAPDSRAGGLPPSSKILTLTIDKDKTKPPVCIDFDDPCYVSGFNCYHFFFNCIQQWKVIICGSSGAVDVPVIGQDEADKKWYKWDLDDTARPEVPLSDSGDECFVVGMALDYSSSKNVELSDVRTLPPCPLLLIFSTGGTLMPYTIINEKCPDDALKALVRPPKPLPAPSLLSSALPNVPGPHPSSLASVSVPHPSGSSAHTFSVGAIQQQMPGIQGTSQTSLSGSGDPRSQTSGTPGILSQPMQPLLLSQSMTPPSSMTIPKFSLGSSPATTVPRVSSSMSTLQVGTSPQSHIPLSHIPQNLGTRPLTVVQPTSNVPILSQPQSGGSTSVRPPPGPSAGGTSVGPPTGPSAGSTSVRPPTGPSAGGTSVRPLTGPSAGGTSVRPPTGPSSHIPLSHIPQNLGTRPLTVVQPTSNVPILSQPQSGGSTSVRPPPGPSAGGTSVRPPTGPSAGSTSIRPPTGPSAGSTSVRPPTGPGPIYRPPVSTVPGPPLGVASVPRPVLTSTPHVRPPFTHSFSLPPPPGSTGPPPTTVQSSQGHHPALTPTSAKPAGGVPPDVPLIRQDTQSINEDHDSNYSGYIEKEIQKFQDEMVSLKEEADEVTSHWEIKDPQSQRDVIESETSQLEKAVERQNQNTKFLFDDVRLLGEKVLKGFELAEESRVRLLRRSDPQHTVLCKKQPLDPYRARRMDEIRSRYALVDQKLRDVNSQLDSELERKTNSHRSKGRSPMRDPRSLDIYTALRNHKNVLRAQTATLNDLTSQMKSLRLISRSWRPVSVRDSTQTTQGSDSLSTTTGPASHHTSFCPPQDSNSQLSSPAEKKRMKLLMEQLKKIEVTPKRVVKRDIPIDLGTSIATPPQGSTLSILSSVPEDIRHSETNSITSQPPDSVSDSGGEGSVDKPQPTHSAAGGIPSYLQPVSPNYKEDESTGAYIIDGFGHIVKANKNIYFDPSKAPSGLGLNRVSRTEPGFGEIRASGGPGAGGFDSGGPGSGGTHTGGPGAGGIDPSVGLGTGGFGSGGPGAGGFGSGGPGAGGFGSGGPGSGGIGMGGSGSGGIGMGGLRAGGFGSGGPGSGGIGMGGSGSGGIGMGGLRAGGFGSGGPGSGGIGMGGSGSGGIGMGGPGAGGFGSGGPGSGGIGMGGSGSGGIGMGGSGAGGGGFGSGGPGARDIGTGGPGAGCIGTGRPGVGVGGVSTNGGTGTGGFGTGESGVFRPEGTRVGSQAPFLKSSQSLPYQSFSLRPTTSAGPLLPLPTTVGPSPTSTPSLVSGPSQTTGPTPPPPPPPAAATATVTSAIITKPQFGVPQPLMSVSQPQASRSFSYPLGVSLTPSLGFSLTPSSVSSGPYRSTVEWGKPPSTGVISQTPLSSLSSKTQASSLQITLPSFTSAIGGRSASGPVSAGSPIFTSGGSLLLSSLTTKPLTPPIIGSGVPPLLSNPPVTSNFNPAPLNQLGPLNQPGPPSLSAHVGAGAAPLAVSCSQPGLVTMTLSGTKDSSTQAISSLISTSVSVNMSVTSSSLTFPSLVASKPGSVNTLLSTAVSTPLITSVTQSGLASTTSSLGIMSFTVSKPTTTAGMTSVGTAVSQSGRGPLPHTTTTPSAIPSLGGTKPGTSTSSTVVSTQPGKPQLSTISTSTPLFSPTVSTKTSIPFSKSLSFTPGGTKGYNFSTGVGSTPASPSIGPFLFGPQKPPVSFATQFSMPTFGSSSFPTKVPLTHTVVSTGQPVSTVAMVTTSSIPSLAGTSNTTTSSTFSFSPLTQPAKGTHPVSTTTAPSQSSGTATVTSTLASAGTGEDNGAGTCNSDQEENESNSGSGSFHNTELSSSRPGSSLSLPRSESEKTSQDKTQEISVTSSANGTTQPSSTGIPKTHPQPTDPHAQTTTTTTSGISQPQPSLLSLMSKQLSNDKPSIPKTHSQPTDPHAQTTTTTSSISQPQPNLLSLMSKQLSNDKPNKQDFSIPTTSSPSADQSVTTSPASSVVSSVSQVIAPTGSRPGSGEGTTSKKDSGSSTPLNQQNVGNSDVEGDMEADEDPNFDNDVPDTNPLASLSLGSVTPSGSSVQRNPFGGGGPLSSHSQPSLLGSQSSQQPFGLLQPSKLASGFSGASVLQQTPPTNEGTGFGTTMGRGIGAPPLSNPSLVPSFGSPPQFGSGKTLFGSSPFLRASAPGQQNFGRVFGEGSQKQQDTLASFGALAGGGSQGQQESLSSFGALAEQGSGSFGTAMGGSGTMSGAQFTSYRS